MPKRFALRLRAVLAYAACCSAPAVADVCDRWTDYRGTPLFRDGNGPAYWFVTAHKSVDADGAPNAYHPDDVGKPCRSAGRGLDCPENAGYPAASWWPDVLVRDPASPTRAFVQPSGPFAGYFVSKTALQDRAKADTDPEKYVDATRIPYLVFPGRFYRLPGTGRLGDLGVAIHVETGLETPFIVGDVGPSNAPLGEASIALFAQLGGSDVNARTGGGVPRGDVLYVVFPYARVDERRPWPATISQMAARIDELSSQIPLARVRECAAARRDAR